MNEKDKIDIRLFGTALFTSLLFYFVNQHSVYSHLDLYCLYFGIALPFIIILVIRFKMLLDVPEYVWGF